MKCNGDWNEGVLVEDYQPATRRAPAVGPLEPWRLFGENLRLLGVTGAAQPGRGRFQTCPYVHRHSVFGLGSGMALFVFTVQIAIGDMGIHLGGGDT